jgi:preprotein translocase subunit YajC
VTPHLLLFTPAGGGSTQSIFLLLWYGLGFGGIFYMFIIRPERQRRKQHGNMLAALKKGDEITTTGGVIGEIVQMKDSRLTIRSGESKLVVDKEQVVRVTTPKSEGTPA